jgi:hypothetical protein
MGGPLEDMLLKAVEKAEKQDDDKRQQPGPRGSSLGSIMK